jgi:hypothetical protein
LAHSGCICGWVICLDRQTLLHRAAQFVEAVKVTNTCIVCNTNLEVQQHHIIPRHLGGPDDGPLVPICSLHHLLIHRQSSKDESSFTPAQLQIISMLRRFIIIAKQTAEDMDPTLVDRKSIVVLPHGLQQRAHKRKQDLGYSNFQDYILHLVHADCEKL